ncbi:MAG TPA: MFS transporter [Bryobacteraceae bacterium]|nr:MFS transporter [Bryobacteraceae bacterium]
MPRYARAVMAALRFSAPDTEPLAALTEPEWSKALAFADRAQLKLPLGLRCRESLPDSICADVNQDLCNNAERWRRVKAVYCEVASAFDDVGLEFAVLKGFSHCPLFAADSRHRAQFDIDLLLPPSQLGEARDVALRLGYEPAVPFDQHPTDHLPALVRKNGWEWRGGSFYDPEIPLSLELHFRLWDERTERFAPAGLDCFWERRQERELDGLKFVGLHAADAVGYATLHLLRHLLRGDLRPYHLYETAYLLHRSAGDTLFWTQWHELHDASLRRLEAICFSLAERWFDCRLPVAVSEEFDHLPQDVRRWLDTFSESPLTGLFHPNKDEVWLHWSLVESRRDRWAVLRRRAMPEQLPSPVSSVHIPEQQLTWRIRLRDRWRYWQYCVARAAHHVRALRSVAWSGVRWFGAPLELGAEYWRFLLSEGCFDFGMFVFVFLYNLYLLQLGFREDFLGLMSGINTAGNVAGSVLSVFAIRRFGMRRTLMASFGLTAGLCALRAVVTPAPALLALAALAGLASSVWPVALAPIIASVTTDKSRQRGFSFICASGISIGILGGLAAGRLPGWLMRARWTSSTVASYRVSLLAGCTIVLLALWPLARVRMTSAAPPGERRLQRPSPLVLRFLAAMLVWNLATGMFNPFPNVYLARLHLPLQQIGYAFSASQLAQVAAVLLAPVLFRRLGLTRAISGMQFFTAIALVALASAAGPLWAAGAFAGYMAFQYMSEPGMFTLLMEVSPEVERSSASALNILVMFAGQAIAATISGSLLARFGYPPVLTVAAIIAAAVALLFRLLMNSRKPSSPANA